MSSSSGTGMAARYFPALQQRNYRLFWTGQCVSLVGSWMQNVGQAWLVLQLTHDPAKLGIVGAAQFLPMMFLSLFAGPFIDRYPKRRILIATQASLLALALALAVLTAFNVISYWMVLVLALLLGFVNLVDMPTRQAYVIELSGREHLMNAVSLNSAAFNLARMIGPAIAGLLMEGIGIAPCFFFNALSFVAVIAALFAIDAPPVVAATAVSGPKEVLASVVEGLGYIRDRASILAPLALLAVISTVVMNFNVFVPTFAEGPLGQGASGFGFLMTSMGIGSLVAALGLAARSSKGPSLLRLYGGAAGSSLALAACGLQRSFALSCVLLGLAGFFTITFSATTNATIQLKSDDAHRGRVMSVYALVIGGLTPIGALYAGFLTKAAGPGLCLFVSGTVGLLASLPFALGAFRGHRAAGS